jgi:hypothetical protein
MVIIQRERASEQTKHFVFLQFIFPMYLFPQFLYQHQITSATVLAMVANTVH